MKQKVALIVALLVVAVFAYQCYRTRERQNRIEQIISGEVRGNKESLIFFVPTCPQYDAIQAGHIRSFATVYEAEQADYRPAINCSDAIVTRKINENETDDTVLAPDRPY